MSERYKKIVVRLERANISENIKSLQLYLLKNKNIKKQNQNSYFVNIPVFRRFSRFIKKTIRYIM